jgi:hypothetical protein
LFWGALFALGKEDFHKIKGRTTLSTSRNDLNTTDNNMGLTESFSTSTELRAWEFKKFEFEFSFDF